MMAIATYFRTNVGFSANGGDKILSTNSCNYCILKLLASTVLKRKEGEDKWWEEMTASQRQQCKKDFIRLLNKYIEMPPNEAAAQGKWRTNGSKNPKKTINGFSPPPLLCTVWPIRGHRHMNDSWLYRIFIEREWAKWWKKPIGVNWWWKALI